VVTPLQSAVLDTGALQGWDSMTGLRLDELQSQPAEFAGLGRADCGAAQALFDARTMRAVPLLGAIRV
jgi:hypothetical protein